ncbi:twin-arginine translocase subunit TatC [Longispora sp. NPDC051575]|uniref:twin-arginine translocase subunit TatC n=1 Tax=Longispora sp. NPDC051575 TaxID=3154943 RepID=UPI00344512B7
MSPVLRKRSAARSKPAADGSMPLMEHLRELRNRLFKAFLGILVGFIAIYVFKLHTWILERLQEPYRDLFPDGQAPDMLQLGVGDVFLLKLKVAMWAGLVVAAPVWLYQIWAFVAPGLHKRERRWAYAFVAAATPLFLTGAFLAYLVVGKGLEFLLPAQEEHLTNSLELTRYVSWVTNFMLIFGVAFEFPLLAVMLNFAGLVSAKKMLSWWRTVVFLFFIFAAIATPTPDPFVMTGLALALSLMYFIAIGIAWLNDRRRGRKSGAAEYANLADDEAAPLDYKPEPVAEPEPVPEPEKLDRRSRFDDSI